MKNASKKWYNYLISVAGIGLFLAIGLLLFYKIGEPNWPLKYTWFLLIFGGVFCLLVGFIIQDLYRGWNRHKLKDWDNPLPEKIVNKAWSIFYPILCCGLPTFLIGLIGFLVTKC